MTERGAPAPLRARLLADPVMFCALGFGSGLTPRAPGTAGSIVGVLLAAALAGVGTGEPLYLLATAALIAAGVPICARAGRRLGQHDHPAIVWDELASFPLVLLGLPATWPWLLAGFVAFRVFDVLKPWPIRWLDRRLPGGLGVMADDVAAALAACGVLHGARLLLAG
ncbi:MAG: phosphatidylglycerophosphatase A [Halofilum sp. (in: g-proteobacteria)]|nr:phosphatidylglycerophosphatase A [Halofilum sp. (in: g-proteobacteria)]